MNNVEILHAALSAFCSTDLSRPILHRPYYYNGAYYATDGRSCIKIPANGFHNPKVAVAADEKSIGICKAIDEFVTAYADCTLENQPQDHIVKRAAYLALQNAREAEREDPDEEGTDDLDIRIRSTSLVRFPCGHIRAFELLRTISALEMIEHWGTVINLYFSRRDKNDGYGIVIESGDVKICTMAVRGEDNDFVADFSYSITDAMTGMFIKKREAK